MMPSMTLLCETLELDTCMQFVCSGYVLVLLYKDEAIKVFSLFHTIRLLYITKFELAILKESTSYIYIKKKLFIYYIHVYVHFF